MITQIQINFNELHACFPSIDCDTYPEPFLSYADYYIIFKDTNPSQIKDRELETQLKLFDRNIDMDDGSTLFYQYFNLEKVYAYMLKKLLRGIK